MCFAGWLCKTRTENQEKNDLNTRTTLQLKTKTKNRGARKKAT